MTSFTISMTSFVNNVVSNVKSQITHFDARNKVKSDPISNVKFPNIRPRSEVLAVRYDDDEDDGSGPGPGGAKCEDTRNSHAGCY